MRCGRGWRSGWGEVRSYVKLKAPAGRVLFFHVIIYRRFSLFKLTVSTLVVQRIAMKKNSISQIVRFHKWIIPLFLLLPTSVISKCNGTIFTLTQLRDGAIVEQWITPEGTYHEIETPLQVIPSDVITLTYSQYGVINCLGSYTVFFDDIERDSNIPPGVEPMFPLNEQGSYRIIAYNYWPGILLYQVQHVSVGIEEPVIDQPLLFPSIVSSMIAPFQTDFSITDVKIIDLTGKVVHLDKGKLEQPMHIGNLCNGYYVIVCRVGEKSYRQRFFIR